MNPHDIQIGAAPRAAAAMPRMYADDPVCSICWHTTSVTVLRLVPTEYCRNAADGLVALCDGCRPLATTLTDVQRRICAALVQAKATVGVVEPSNRASTAHAHASGATQAHVRQRDGGICQLCGHVEVTAETVTATVGDVPPEIRKARQLETGHVLSWWDANELEIPATTANHPDNLVSMCHDCNVGIGRYSPPLRLGLRWIVKPWTLGGFA